jgi:small subunit ribosomal protein S18
MSDYSRKPKRRYCAFCKDKVEYLDYKDVNMLRKYTTDRGKIKPRRVSGNCAQHQHRLATAVKRAREMALIPYAVPVVSGKVDGKSRR